MTGSAVTGSAEPKPQAAPSSSDPRVDAHVIGLLTSVGETLDAFFLEIAERWREQGAVVESAAGSLAETFEDAAVLPSVTRRPALRNRRAGAELREWVRAKGIDVVITNITPQRISIFIRCFRVNASCF